MTSLCPPHPLSPPLSHPTWPYSHWYGLMHCVPVRSHPLFHFHQTRVHTHHPSQPCTCASGSNLRHPAPLARPYTRTHFHFLDEVPPRSQCREILSLIFCIQGFPITHHNGTGRPVGHKGVHVRLSFVVTVWATGWCIGLATLSSFLLEALGTNVLHCYLPLPMFLLCDAACWHVLAWKSLHHQVMFLSSPLLTAHVLPALSTLYFSCLIWVVSCLTWRTNRPFLGFQVPSSPPVQNWCPEWQSQTRFFQHCRMQMESP